MPIPTDATTERKMQEQRENENADAAAAAGFEPLDLPGASDGLTSDPAAQAEPERRKSQAELVRENQQKHADDREEFLANIQKQRRQHLAEGEEDADDVNAFRAELDIDGQSTENQEQENPVVAAAPEVPAAPTGPRFFVHTDGKEYCELKVNGVLKVVPAETVYAAAQKIEAGDERLRQAAQERTQLENDRLRFQQEQAARQIKQPSVDPDAAANLKAQLRENLERLYNGEENAIDSLTDILTQGRNDATQPVDIHQIAQEAITIQNQRNWDAALIQDSADFDSDPAYADITGNTLLTERAKQHAMRITHESDARNRNISPRRIMQEAAELTRNEAIQSGLLAPKAPVQEQVARADATASRKQQLGNTVTGGAAPRSQATGQRPVNPDGGRSPTSMDSKAAAFAGMKAVRTQPAIKR